MNSATRIVGLSKLPNSKRILLAGFVLVLLLSACGGGGEEEPTFTSAPTGQPAAAPTSTSAAQPPTAEPTATLSTEPTATRPAEPTEDTGSGELLGEPLDLGSINVDPEELSSSALQSYRLRVEWTVEPKPESDEGASSMTMDIVHTSDPLAEQFSVTGDDGSTFAMIRIGDKLWLQSGDQWIEMSSDDMASSMDDFLFDLGQATAGLSGDARLVGSEEVNGIATRHYSFDETVPGIALGMFGKIKGDVWVAEEGDYAVRYVYSAEDDKATYRWDWEVYDVNAPITIEPPAGAQAAREDVPLMPDASNRASLGGMTSYESASDVTTVIDFYKEQMPDQGWAYNETESTISEFFNSLSFTKEDITVVIMITAQDGGGTTVLIQVGE